MDRVYDYNLLSGSLWVCRMRMDLVVYRMCMDLVVVNRMSLLMPLFAGDVLCIGMGGVLDFKMFE